MYAQIVGHKTATSTYRSPVLYDPDGFPYVEGINVDSNIAHVLVLVQCHSPCCCHCHVHECESTACGTYICLHLQTAVAVPGIASNQRVG